MMLIALFVLASSWFVAASSRGSGVGVGEPLLTYSSCAARGFAAGAVACGTCRDIVSVLGAASDAASACAACCTPSLDLVRDGAPRVFSSASVAVCRPRLAQTGGVQEWVEKSASTWAARGVEVVESEGCDGGFGGFGGFGGGFGMPGMPPPPAQGAGPSVVLRDDGDSDEAAVRVPVGTWKTEWISALLARHVSTSDDGEL